MAWVYGWVSPCAMNEMVQGLIYYARQESENDKTGKPASGVSPDTHQTESPATDYHTTSC